MRTKEEILSAIKQHDKLEDKARCCEKHDEEMVEFRVANALRWVLGEEIDAYAVPKIAEILKSVGVEKELTLFVPRGIRVRIYD